MKNVYVKLLLLLLVGRGGVAAANDEYYLSEMNFTLDWLPQSYATAVVIGTENYWGGSATSAWHLEEATYWSSNILESAKGWQNIRFSYGGATVWNGAPDGPHPGDEVLLIIGNFNHAGKLSDVGGIGADGSYSNAAYAYGYDASPTSSVKYFNGLASLTLGSDFMDNDNGTGGYARVIGRALTNTFHDYSEAFTEFQTIDGGAGSDEVVLHLMPDMQFQNGSWVVNGADQDHGTVLSWDDFNGIDQAIRYLVGWAIHVLAGLTAVRLVRSGIS